MQVTGLLVYSTVSSFKMTMTYACMRHVN